ncbi:helix-turn-helix domain-containing protein [Streptomyces sp. NPDC001812]|uniref:Helix-turn-helix transcriptional regulator n=1 Tax=Streptomyces cathayae TaxID=3031124 RepID=A0ABY8K7P4_9ACTN|nr:helix-turn-helix transcriptional regulator [Streptomyces sp. HUAS 5]WGD42493.1 helix-turn-helix transcriptional regulator [Streptomyces sp. HUAS 5]
MHTKTQLRTGPEDVARFLRQLREAHGLSQRALATRLGVSQARVARLESGANNPQLDTLAAYVAALGGTLSLHADFDT